MAPPVKPINVAANEAATAMEPRLEILLAKVERDILEEKEQLSQGIGINRISHSLKHSVNDYLDTKEAVRILKAIAQEGIGFKSSKNINAHDLFDLSNYNIILHDEICAPIASFVLTYEQQLVESASTLLEGSAVGSKVRAKNVKLRDRSGKGHGGR